MIKANHLIEHRLSCHRCGNMRKAVVQCPLCPQVFCITCSEKMIEMDGKSVFVDGCPVCKFLCCCGPHKSVDCTRLYHCYKKCPATKTKRSVTTKSKSSSDLLTGSSSESSRAVCNKEIASLSVKRTHTASQLPCLDDSDSPPIRKVPRVMATGQDEKPCSILQPVSLTPVNNVFFLQSALPPTHLSSIQPLLDLRRPSNYVYDLTGWVTFSDHSKGASDLYPTTPKTRTELPTDLFTPTDCSVAAEGLLLTTDGLESLCSGSKGSTHRFDDSLTRSLNAVSDSDDSYDLDTVNQLLRFNNGTFKGLYSGSLSVPGSATPSKASVVTEDLFTFTNTDLLVTPIAERLMDVTDTLPTTWTGQSFDLGGVIYSPVGFVDIPPPPPTREVYPTLRELSSLFCQENCFNDSK